MKKLIILTIALFTAPLAVLSLSGQLVAQTVESGSSTSHYLNQNNLERSSSRLVNVLASGEFRGSDNPRHPMNIFTNGLKAWIEAGNDPHQYLDNAFGDYVSRAVAAYQEAGQVITFDDAMTSMDQAIIIYNMSQGANVPNMRENMQSDGPITIHYYMDDSYINNMQRTLGQDVFNAVYPGVADRSLNPVRIDGLRIDSKRDVERLAAQYPNDENLQNRIIPWINARRAEDNAPFNFNYHNLNPNQPIHIADSDNEVIVEYYDSRRNEDLFWGNVNGRTYLIARSIGTNSRGQNVFVQTQHFDELENVTNAQLGVAHRVIVTPSQALELQNRLTNLRNNNIREGWVQMINSARNNAYECFPAADDED